MHLQVLGWVLLRFLKVGPGWMRGKCWFAPRSIHSLSLIRCDQPCTSIIFIFDSSCCPGKNVLFHIRVRPPFMASNTKVSFCNKTVYLLIYRSLQKVD